MPFTFFTQFRTQASHFFENSAFQGGARAGVFRGARREIETSSSTPPCAYLKMLNLQKIRRLATRLFYTKLNAKYRNLTLSRSFQILTCCNIMIASNFFVLTGNINPSLPMHSFCPLNFPGKLRRTQRISLFTKFLSVTRRKKNIKYNILAYFFWLFLGNHNITN